MDLNDRIRELDRKESGQSDGIEDMINLMNLNEDSLLWNLQKRYEKQFIYTYTGSILVAVNPYKMFNIYGLDMVKKYEGKVLGSLSPHLFAIGSAAYSKMNKDTENQVIVISGESGAGKTESTKLLMQYLAAVNKSGNNLITEQILEATPLLESFGNAKTIRNDNSSRFGKYVEVYFNRGSIMGAKTSEYLLEKSRIVTQNADERNYHIFYELLEGLPPKKKEEYGLETSSKYFYLNQGGSATIDQKDDKNDFEHVQSALQVLGFSSAELDIIYRILASVLHIGNVYFQRAQQDKYHEGIELGDDVEIKWVAHLLQLSPKWLQQALTCKVTEARRERVLTPFTIDQALDTRDAIAKALYSRTFTWLVQKINTIVNKKAKERAAASIAILDIFGFEDFRVNSFEQLCINYANETLQFYFNKHIFKIEQQQYSKERIDWDKIEFHDNQPTLDLLSKKPSGIFHLLDDESNFPQSTDQSFLEKCHFTHAAQTNLYRKPRMGDPEFMIRHYAGQVTYNVRNFLDKNKDTLRSDVMDLMIQSKNEMISKMFQEYRDSTMNRTVSKLTGFVTMKNKTPTVAYSFHESLNQLMENMSKCNPWFVRCIKPNNEKAAMTFERSVVLDQLRYTGMLETIKIRKMGYPTRLSFRIFAGRYYVLIKDKRSTRDQEEKNVCRNILSNLGNRWKESWQLGNTKVFMKESLGYYLDEQRNTKVTGAVLILQQHTRGYLARKEFLRTRNAAIRLQTAIRRWRERSRYNVIRNGFVKAQAQYRMMRQRKQYLKIRDEMRRRKEYEKRRHQQDIEAAKLVDARNREVKAKETVLQKPGQLDRALVARYEKQKTLQHVTRMEKLAFQERQARTVTKVSHLEIPEELARIFKNLEDWQGAQNERNLIQAVETVQPKNMNFALPTDIDAYVFSKFTNVYFIHEWRMKKVAIRSPFLKKHSIFDDKESVSLFKLIMRFMNDPNLSATQERVMADYIVQKGLMNEPIRDEVYAQLCNQTWMNRHDANRERGWLLMANCLSCFPPSDTLARYLLKYVSDQAQDGYKSFCQHKLLQCLDIDRGLCRTYPPCLLEWKAAKKKATMALEAVFADGEKALGHVESWTTGEEFASHLLQCRQVYEGNHGWTLALQDDNATYELLGQDYALDLISEMEVPPGFPYCKSHFLVSTDRSRETTSYRRHLVQGTPHDPDIIKAMDVDVPDLEEPIPVSPRQPPEPADFFKYRSVASSVNGDPIYGSGEEAMSRTSNLNKRSATDDPALSKDSILNVRYVKRPAPAPPSINGERNSIASSDDMDLSNTKLNRRYTATPVNGHVPNGNIPNGEATELGKSKLNSRYTKKGIAVLPNGALDQNAREMIARRQRSYESSERGGSMKSGGPEDLERWVDNVFDSALGGNLEDLSDARTLEYKLKGLGKGLPGLITNPQPGVNMNEAFGQQPLGGYQQPFGANFGLPSTSMQQPPLLQQPVLSAPATGSINVGNLLSPNAQPFVMGNPLAQANAIGMPSQQAVQQAAMQQHLEQERQQAMIAAQQLQQENMKLHAQLQTQNLQQQILQANVQSEYLRNQLIQLKQTNEQLEKKDEPMPIIKTDLPQSPQPSPQSAPNYVNAVTPGPSVSRKPSFKTREEIIANTHPRVQVKSSDLGEAKQGEIDQRHPGGVKTLKQAFEKKGPPPVSQNMFIRPENTQQTDSTPKGVTFTASNEIIPETAAPKSPSPQLQQQQPVAPKTQVISEPLPGAVKAVTIISLDDSEAIPPPPQHPPPPPPLPTSIPEKTSVPTEEQEIKHTPPPAPPLPLAQQQRQESVPPPPPPPPPASTEELPKVEPPKVTTTSAEEVPSQPEQTSPTPKQISGPQKIKDKHGKITGVKVGKIQWPPPEKEVERKEKVEVGRLLIDEQKIDTKTLKKNKDDTHAAAMALIRSRSTLAQKEESILVREPPKQSFEDVVIAAAIQDKKVDIDMENRRRMLEQRLSQHGILNNKPEPVEKKKEVKIIPKEEPKKEPKKEPIKPPPRKGHLSISNTSQHLPLSSLPLPQTIPRPSPQPILQNTREPSLQQLPLVSLSEKQIPQQTMPLQNDTVLQSQKVSLDFPLTSTSSYLQPPCYSLRPEHLSAAPKLLMKSALPQIVEQRSDAVDAVEIEQIQVQIQRAPVVPQTIVDDDEEGDYRAELKELERIRTKLFSQNGGPFFHYNRVPWALEIRKEIFTPTEKVENTILINLLFCQIVQDTFSMSCIRISKECKMKMRGMLESCGVSPSNVVGLQAKEHIKKQVIDTAREWPYYFSRLFPVSGRRRHPHVHYVGVSHTGIRLLSREKDLYEDNLKVLEHFNFESVIDVSVPQPCTLQIHVRRDYIIVYTPRAHQLKNLIDAFCIESDQDMIYVRAVKSYITRESTLLSFQMGDIIKLTNKNMMLQRGWLYGSLHGRAGMFPAEYVVPMARHEVQKEQSIRSTSPLPSLPSSPPRERRYSREDNESEINDTLSRQQPVAPKLSMLEFALLYFRESPFRYEMARNQETGSIHGTLKMISSLKAKTVQKLNQKKGKVSDWTWREQVNMIRWTKDPIQASLLKFDPKQNAMNKGALECFLNVMRFMGDYPLEKGKKAIDAALDILLMCHRHPGLRDEAYCQVIKQTTNNRSTRPDSLQQGWRLLSILTPYFDCTDVFKPYLFKYLEQTAYDSQRPHNGIANQCLQNLRITFRFGGRKNVPGKPELDALARGKVAKRQMCFIPGGLPVVLNVRSSTVILDCIDQICGKLEIPNTTEREEYTVFYVIESESLYSALSPGDYLFDLTTELLNQRKTFYLLLQRTSWYFPLKLDGSDIYIDFIYHQCLPDYLDGFLLPTPPGVQFSAQVKDQVCMLAALQMKAASKKGVQSQKEILENIPKTAHAVQDIKWANLVQEKVKMFEKLSPHESKAKFLEILSEFRLYGSTFFPVKNVTDQRLPEESLLGISKNGVHFLNIKTHEIQAFYPFSEVISARRFRAENGNIYLDMKCGNLMVQKFIRIETEQGGDISKLIGQYIQINRNATQQRK